MSLLLFLSLPLLFLNVFEILEVVNDNSNLFSEVLTCGLADLLGLYQCLS